MGLLDIFRRAKKIKEVQKHAGEPLPSDAGPFDLGPGDTIEVMYENYLISGRAEYSHDYISLTIEKGNDIKFLFVFDGSDVTYGLFTLVDGRMQSRTEVQDKMVLDDVTYYLEREYDKVLKAYDKSRLDDGNVHVWEYKSDDNKLLRIEYQNGEFVIYEGNLLDKSEVKIVAHREV